MAIPEVTETKEETEAGIREHGEWIMGHPEIVCRILAFTVQRLGTPLSKSRVTKTAIGEVADMCTHLGVCFGALGEAIYRENMDEAPMDFDAMMAKEQARRPNPLRN